jgi:hypothetical protein
LQSIEQDKFNQHHLRQLITYAYEKILWMLSKNKYDDEPTECLSPEQTQEEKFDALRDVLKLSLPIVTEITRRYLGDQKKTEDSHEGIKGIDHYKKAGYATFWISKLKPIMITGGIPKSFGISPNEIMLINEHLAISVACAFLVDKHKANPPLSKKIIRDFKYTLRYRINTRHQMVLIYEALCRFFDQ